MVNMAKVNLLDQFINFYNSYNQSLGPWVFVPKPIRGTTTTQLTS